MEKIFLTYPPQVKYIFKKILSQYLIFKTNNTFTIHHSKVSHLSFFSLFYFFFRTKKKEEEIIKKNSSQSIRAIKISLIFVFCFYSLFFLSFYFLCPLWYFLSLVIYYLAHLFKYKIWWPKWYIIKSQIREIKEKER